jgi:hypothetical protein
MDLRSSGGTFQERAAAFAALRTIWGGHRLRGVGIARIFAGTVGAAGHASPEKRLRALATEWGDLDRKAAKIFRQAVEAVDRHRQQEGRPKLDAELHALAAPLTRARALQDDRNKRSVLIREVREALAWTGVQLLQPDLVILDEFQRFRELMDETSDDWTGALARSLFKYEHKDFGRATRVLLLSATPYVMHTTSAEAAAGSDRHYEDFLATYRFLANGLPGVDAVVKQEELKARLSHLRTSILDAQITGAGPVQTAMAEVSTHLTEVMVRTERLSSTIDHNGMLTTIHDPVGPPTPTALVQYVDCARVAEHLRAHSVVSTADVMEYWKSAPYTLSFLGGHEYMLSKGLRERSEAGGDDDELERLLRTSTALLPWRVIDRYKKLDPANGRLECLWSDLFDAGAHRLLWMPPACPYYAKGGRFETAEARALTKRLIFSSWNLVPTVVSTLTSFEAERRLHDEAKRAGATVTTYSTEANRRHTRHLQLRQGTQSMTAMIHRVPSPALAELADPLVLAADLGSSDGPATWKAVYERAKGVITEALADVLPQRRGTGPGSAGWYVLAPMLLDSRNEETTGYSPRSLTDAWFGSRDEATTLKRYLLQLQDWLAVLDPGPDVAPDYAEQSPLFELEMSKLPPVPEDLEDVLTLSALASPSACAYRSLSRHFANVPVSERVQHAAAVAEAIVSLLNSWEATRIIDAYPAEGDYWYKSLHYCADGNLQSVLDEYVAMLVEWRGYDRQGDRSRALEQAVEDLETALTLRTAVYRVMRAKTGRRERDTLRGRFAVRFGDADSEDQQQQRVDAVSLAFNSPFWPFVLTSTSVGQEGLDFHLYCHAVSHWNLPSNPVDLEQREGRVHRYKGHAIRKNVGLAVGPPSGNSEPWAELFARAAAGRDGTHTTDLVPYWIYLPDHLPETQLSRIERHLPITPYSREASRIGPLLASVAFYRLAFGQPRQEELLAHVLTNITDKALRTELANVRVDLSPPIA